MAEQSSLPALEYSRNTYAGTLEWYKSAESKAQVLLTLDGVFLSFLTSSVFVPPGNIRPVVAVFGPETWAFSCALVLSMLGSIFAALATLRSRIAPPEDVRSAVERARTGVLDDATVLYFFGHVAALPDHLRTTYAEKILAMTEHDEARVMSSQAFLVSKNVAKKHEWVNVGFFFAALSLVLFLLAGVSYGVRVAS